MRLASPLVAATFLLAACGTQATAGSAGPTPPGASDATTASSSPSVVEPSPSSSRPAQLDLNGLDTCTTIPDDVLRSMGYSPSSEGQDQTGVSQFGCTFRDINAIYGSALFFDTGKGYEQYRSSIGTVVTESVVEGFEAYVVQDQQLGGCTVGVDIADSQSLTTNRTGPLGEPVAPLCDRAAEFAAAAITALTQK